MGRPEQRRVRLAQRQLLLAQIARREARHALASALAEEARCASVDARSRDLLNEYSRRIFLRSEPNEAQALGNDFAFTRSLAAMAQSAQAAHRRAADRAQGQAATLAAAETRLSRHESRNADAARALEALDEHRDMMGELALAPCMARKLQGLRENPSSRSSPDLPASSQRTRK
jgi:hypothetical protein